MTVDALSIKNSLQNLISKNNTVTSSYDVSNSLNNRVQLVCGGTSARVPELNIMYPVIFVELENIVDEHIELGKTSRRNVELIFGITGIIEYGIGIQDDGESTDNECVQLSQNVVELLRNYVTISTTVDSCLVTGTEFITDEGTYNARSKISLLVRKRG